MPSKLESLKEKSKSFLKRRKKNIISFFIMFVLLFFSFLCCSLSSLGFSTYHESVARKMGNKTYVCEIKSSKEDDTFRGFFSYADDLAGAEIKRNVDSFILCEEKNGQCPSEFILSDTRTVKIHSVFQQTNWRFDLLNYGFKTFTGKPIRNIDYDEIYIDELMAMDLINELECDENDLVGMQLNLKTKSAVKNVRIVDIIINFNKLNFGPYFPKGTMITSFSNTAAWFSNSKYVFVLRGDYLSKNYQIKFIDNAKKRTSKTEIQYIDTYYRLSGKKLVDDGIQKLKENTEALYRGKNKKYGLFSIMPIMMMTLIGAASLYKFINKEFYLSLIASAFLYLLLSAKFVPCVIINNSIVLLANSAASIMIVCFIVLAVCVYLLFVPEKDETDTKPKRKRWWKRL